jgi:hypothetical protein
LGGQRAFLDLERYAKTGARGHVDELIQREKIDLSAREFGNAGLGDAQKICCPLRGP